MDTIDLRSDTVTHPVPAMREAMAKAVVGDDVYGEDPTVNELQAYAADLLGKEAALFTLTATQANIIATLTHCARGDELIVGRDNHIFQWEVGGASVLGGVSMNTVPVAFDGTLSLDDIKAAIRFDPSHHPHTALICVENTHGGRGATAVSVDFMDRVGTFAHEHGLKLHVDGARLFNAAAALRVLPREIVKHADSVQICLSKGLCAPMGALLVGSPEFIERAHHIRKLLGGGTRQAGVVAAAGLIALRDLRERLVDDHATARRLAEGLAAIEGITVDPVHARTNMVFFSIPATLDSAAFVDAMKEQNIILMGGPDFRAVTHYWITPERIELVLAAVREYMVRQKHELPGRV
ncbi:MAG TPA: low-specificity L-threonine aldolase [Aggregatilineales bacterium]|nr:low-specificity L-threonine aldolase [Aggregatilineales bacterium]